MGGRSGSFRHSGGSNKDKIEKVEGGMSIDTADNHNANPNYRGGRKALAEYNSKMREYNALNSEIEQKQAIYNHNPSPGLKRELDTLMKRQRNDFNKLKNMQLASKEYSINCQRAVVAYELRRRGYKVSAQANNGSREGYKAAMSAFKNRNYVVLSRKASKRGSDVDEWAKSRLEKVGQRGVITFRWYRLRSGHTINVERTKKGLLYVDAQTGRKSKSFRSYLSHVRGISRDGFTFARTDNQELNVKNLIDSGVIERSKN